MVLVVKTTANTGDLRETSLILGLGRSPEQEMATHSSILAWKTLWTEELVDYNLWDHRVGHD